MEYEALLIPIFKLLQTKSDTGINQVVGSEKNNVKYTNCKYYQAYVSNGHFFHDSFTLTSTPTAGILSYSAGLHGAFSARSKSRNLASNREEAFHRVRAKPYDGKSIILGY